MGDADDRPSSRAISRPLVCRQWSQVHCNLADHGLPSPTVLFPPLRGPVFPVPGPCK